MPPYSQDSTMLANLQQDEQPHDDVAPSKLEEGAATDTTDSEEEGMSSFFDFNLCTGMSGASMQSAMFKTRICAECGKSVSKVCSLRHRM